MSRFGVFLKVALFHGIILGVILLIPLLKSCELFPEKEQIITVDLGALPPPPPQKEDPPPKEDPVEKEVISEATPVPTPKALPTPTATPAPEPTRVPTATPRPQPTPTPKPVWRARTPEEVRARIMQNQPAPPAPVPTMSPQQISNLLSQGLPTGGGGAATGPASQGAVNFGGVSSELYKRLYSAWDQPTHIASGLKVLASVQVMKSGHIGRTSILKSSGNADLDASVKRALSSVRFAKPLPESYGGDNRTFEIEFTLSP